MTKNGIVSEEAALQPMRKHLTQKVVIQVNRVLVDGNLSAFKIGEVKRIIKMLAPPEKENVPISREAALVIGGVIEGYMLANLAHESKALRKSSSKSPVRSPRKSPVRSPRRASSPRKSPQRSPR